MRNAIALSIRFLVAVHRLGFREVKGFKELFGRSRLKEQAVLELVEIEEELGVKLTRVAWLPGFFSLPPDAQIAGSRAYQQGKVICLSSATGRKFASDMRDLDLSICLLVFMACKQFSRLYMLNVVHTALWDRCSLRCSCGGIGGVTL